MHLNLKKNTPKLFHWLLTKPKTSGFLVFFILIIVVGFFIIQRYQILKENERQEMNNILNAVHLNIEQSLKSCYATTLTLALTINDDGIPENFETIGAQMMETNPNISAVQMVPDGVIKYIYPMKGNEAAMNLNILTSPTLSKEALKSIKTKKMYFAGPFKLIQGGIGIVGRLPVYNKNNFWGFSAVVIRLEKFLESTGINSLENTKYSLQISKKNPITQKEEFFLPQKIDLSKHYYVNSTISDGDWKLYLIVKNPYGIYSLIIFPIISGLITAIFFGFFITILLKKPAELQLLVHNQATKLMDSELKFKAIFDQAAVGIARIDSNTGYFLEVNKQYCDWLGYSQEEMNERNFQSITLPDDLNEDLINLELLKEGKIREYSMEKRYITKSNEVIWVNLTVSPLWKEGEPITNHISIIENISLRKKNEILIKKSEKRFKTLFQDSPLPLWEEDFSAVKNHLQELDLIGKKSYFIFSYFNEHPEVVSKCISLVKIIDVNNECLKLHKVESKKALIENLHLFIGTESIEDVKKQLVAICRNKKHLNIDSKIKDMEGEYRDINLRWNIVKGYEKSLERVIVSTEDITERKINEKIIFNSQRRIKSLINSIDGIVWESDAITFEFTYISDKLIDILGYTIEEWMSSNTFWADHIHDEDRKWAVDYCYTETQKNENHEFEYRMIAKNGSWVWIRDIVTVISKDGKPINLRGIMIDITKTKEAEKDLTNSLVLVTEQNKRLMNFSYIVSHNLRSHTSNMQSILNLIETTESEEERLEFVQLLKTVSGNLDETIHNLNEIVNTQTNIGILTEPLNLQKYIHKIIDIFSEPILACNASIINTVEKDIILDYNPAYLESILLNLVSNAIRYRHPNRKLIITLSCFKEKDKMVLQVSDNGIGIDLKKYGDKIFGMYKTFSNHKDSRGIGLFITKSQVDAMGGNITVESQLNIGSSFKIYFK